MLSCRFWFPLQVQSGIFLIFSKKKFWLQMSLRSRLGGVWAWWQGWIILSLRRFVRCSIILAGCHTSQWSHTSLAWWDYNAYSIKISGRLPKLVIIHSYHINDRKRKDWLTWVCSRGLRSGQETSSVVLSSLKTSNYRSAEGKWGHITPSKKLSEGYLLVFRTWRSLFVGGWQVSKGLQSL